MARYGLPEQIRFCKKCVIPNTRPASSNEYKHNKDHRHEFIQFDEEGVCSACRFCEAKDTTVDWKKREEELLTLLDRYRSSDGSYDCLVPGSGGKDSAYAAHVLKYKYNMHPLTVTWSPHLYTDIGWQNFQNWIHVGGLDNYLFTPNGKIHRLITREAFLNLLHPFQPFILGQKTFAVKMATYFNIPLIFYGESSGQNGTNVSIEQKKFAAEDTDKKLDGSQGHRITFLRPDEDLSKVYLGGKPVSEYLDEGITYGDLEPYLPLDPRVVQDKDIELHYLGYYLKWTPQECYYYAVKHTGFEANPVRTEGTYSKYSSIDDKIDGFFYYTTFIKFGYGRATQDAAQEIRHHHITRDEGVSLVHRFDGEFPERHFKTILEYMGIDEETFWKKIDEFRDPHLWTKESGEWKRKYIVS